jgi:hypothetical protein
VLRRDSGVEKGPSWPAMASGVTGGRRSGGGGGGVLRRGILCGPEETTVELLAASISEQGKRNVRESRLGRARKGKRGGGSDRARRGEEENGAWRPAATRERQRWALVGRRSVRAGRNRGGRVWAGPSEGKRAGPNGNRGIFNLFKIISKGSDLILLKDGLTKF